jgi:hypothetical protein
MYPSWCRLSPLFHQGGQIFIFPAPINHLGERRISQLLCFPAGPNSSSRRRAQVPLGICEWPGEAEPARDLCFDSSMDLILRSRAFEKKVRKSGSVTTGSFSDGLGNWLVGVVDSGCQKARFSWIAVPIAYTGGLPVCHSELTQGCSILNRLGYGRGSQARFALGSLSSGSCERIEVFRG